MCEQIKLLTKNKEKLTKNDILELQEKNSEICLKQVGAIEEAIFSQKESLVKIANETEKLYTNETSLKKEVSEFKNSLSDIHTKAQDIQSQINEKQAKLESEKQKLIVYRELSKFISLHKQINDYIKQNDFNSILPLLPQFKQKSDLLTLSSTYTDIVTNCTNQIRSEYNSFLSINENGFSFTNLGPNINILKTFDLISDFTKYFWDYLVNTYLSSVIKSNATINITDTSFICMLNSTEHTPSSFIDLSLLVLSHVTKYFESHQIIITQNEFQFFVDSILKLSLKLPGGNPQQLQTSMDKLLKSTNTEQIELTNMIKEYQTSIVLDKCRKMLIEGAVFGDIIGEMRKMMKGIDANGMLMKIAVMAVVIWQNEPTKLSSAISTLAAINTVEALECAVMFDETVRNNKK
ncbi:hypothetical protein GPJ56_003649 [Histomonas meleagridis]|uniref:uncharacterized protein n=1 Tax=Histomonas meleagridis TaxID=135588 RepID=UPI0035596284|nr:hypothetical protein GPJ56_003649 [Histomonas meleagridis]KAH0800720.1 hypothetical protein GO595_006473 [Histomonas meleagridis]